jgi:hypothetical protein
MSEPTFATWTEENPVFALIIDGEVVDNFAFPPFPEGAMPEQVEKWIAIFKSNPTLVPSLVRIEPGSTWDGTNFTPPTPAE